MYVLGHVFIIGASDQGKYYDRWQKVVNVRPEIFMLSHKSVMCVIGAHARIYVHVICVTVSAGECIRRGYGGISKTIMRNAMSVNFVYIMRESGCVFGALPCWIYGILDGRRYVFIQNARVQPQPLRQFSTAHAQNIQQCTT